MAAVTKKIARAKVFFPLPLTVEPEKLAEGKYHVAGRGPVIRDAKGEEVARIRSSMAEGPQAYALALKMAAGPEMFDALRRVLAVIDGSLWGASKTVDAVIAARAAIAKAESPPAP